MLLILYQVPYSLYKFCFTHLLVILVTLHVDSTELQYMAAISTSQKHQIFYLERSHVVAYV